jgi:helix-turn-helix resolvase-like protein
MIWRAWTVPHTAQSYPTCGDRPSWTNPATVAKGSPSSAQIDTRPISQRFTSRRIGWPTVVDPDKLAYAAHLRDTGTTIAEIVTKTGITRTSLYRHLPPRPTEPVTAAGTSEPPRPDTDPRGAAPVELARGSLDSL